MKANIINFSLFQIGWFAAILGAAHGYVYPGIFAALMILIIHIKLTKADQSELKLYAFTALIGFIFDGLMQFFNFIIYFNPGWPFPLTPLWIVVMWLLFAMTLNHSLSWLKRRYVLSFVFGALGGPLAYVAGEKLGAVEITSDLSLVILAISWAMITPLLMKYSDRT